MPLKNDVEWIERGLEQPGKNQAGLAAALGKHRSIVTRILKGDRQLRVNEIKIIENYLGVNRGVAAALEERTSVYDDAVPSAPVNQPRGKIFLLEPDGAGAFLIDLDDGAVQLDPKPSRYVSVKGLFGLLLGDDVMAPRYKAGEIAWVHPSAPVRPGDDVLFLEDAGAGRALARIGELRGADAAQWTATLYSDPDEPFTVPRDGWRALKILPRD